MRSSGWRSEVCSSVLVAFKGGHAIPSGRCDTLAVFVDHALAVFLDERTALRRQQVEHVLGRSAEPDALRADDDGSVDQDRMRHHGIEQLRLAQSRVRSEERRVGQEWVRTCRSWW